MNRRLETRFQVYAPAKVALLDDPDQESEAQVLDVSGAGLRLVADRELPEDQIITIETDQHLILADVRSCLPRGNRFGIGAERIHSAAKLALPPASSRAERNQILIEDFHRRLLDELQNPPDRAAIRSSPAVERFEANHADSPAAAAPPEPVATLELQPTFERQTTSEPPTESELKPVSEPGTPGAGLDEPPRAGPYVQELAPAEPPEITRDSQEHVPFVATPITVSSIPSPIDPETEPLTAANPGVAEDANPHTDHGEAALAEAPAAEVVAAAPTISPPLAQREKEPVQTRHAEETVVAPLPAQARSRVMAVVIAAALTVAAWVAFLNWPFTKRPPVAPIATAVQSPPAPVAAPVPAAIPAAPVPKAAGRATPPAGMSRVVITASDRSWVNACADGNPAFSKLFVNGSKQELVFSSRALVRMGSAGPLEIRLNGKSVGPLGLAGQVRVMEFTPSASRFITPGEPGDCTAN
jgi:hypothetical protein